MSKVPAAIPPFYSVLVQGVYAMKSAKTHTHALSPLVAAILPAQDAKQAGIAIEELVL